MPIWLIVLIVILAFILIDQFIKAYASRNRSSLQWQGIDTGLQEIRQRLDSIEGILQQVE